ncbi:MAG: hypothetical protein QOG97_2754 [Acidimicrobiaceae bacterium]|jgi:uncharacterized protein (DUF2252 family)|nr:hypothetical protein [Acidimicrobiaceae bacterium]
MDINKATQRYEAWLRSNLPVVIEADLEYKHQQMADAVFPFFRATFYRWAQRVAQLFPEFDSAPVVLSVGDIHVENYGTWRDADGRLVWGINDFDESTPLSYPGDLVRLATSAALATGEQKLALHPRESADAIIAGYHDGIVRGGGPFVLAERHIRLRRLVTGELRDPVRFWTKMQALPEASLAVYPPEAVDAAVTALPEHGADGGASIRSRRAGLGSLGRPRVVALAPWQGGAVAREVKAILPSAWSWARNDPSPTIHYAEVLDRAVRCRDPHTAVHNRWLVRRLAPDCVRVELADLPAVRDEAALLGWMGFELANVHLGTADVRSSIVEDLAGRPPGWLLSAAERMADDTRDDWRTWRS